MMPNAGKDPYAIYGQTEKVQMSMRICAVWSGHSLFVDIYYSIHLFSKRTTKALISLRKCAGWSEPALSAIRLRTLFVHWVRIRCCGHSLEMPRRGASNANPQHMFSWRNKKYVDTFGWKKCLSWSSDVSRSPQAELYTLATYKNGIIERLITVTSTFLIYQSTGLINFSTTAIFVLSQGYITSYNRHCFRLVKYCNIFNIFTIATFAQRPV